MSTINYKSKITIDRLNRILSLTKLQPSNLEQIATEVGCHRTSIANYVHYLLQQGCLKIDHKVRKASYFAYVKPYIDQTKPAEPKKDLNKPAIAKIPIYKDPLVDMFFGRIPTNTLTNESHNHK